MMGVVSQDKKEIWQREGEQDQSVCQIFSAVGRELGLERPRIVRGIQYISYSAIHESESHRWIEYRSPTAGRPVHVERLYTT